MSLLISFYSSNAFCERLLPAVDNTDYRINIRKDEFNLEDDLLLELEVMGNEWKLKSTYAYSLSEESRPCFACILHDGQIIRLKTGAGENLAVIVTEEKRAFHDFEKFDFSGTTEVSVGRDDSNDIIYDFAGLVSRRHAVISRNNGEAEVVNHSSNGIYVNGEKERGRRPLIFGDYINIMGLHIVYLGEQMAVDTGRRAVKVGNKLRKAENTSESTVVLQRSPSVRPVRTMYHRPPRRYETTSDTYSGPSVLLDRSYAARSLWNRNPSHGDFLIHRVGESGGEPATIDLGKYRLIGITGGNNKKDAADIARAISLQIAAANCYTDIKLAYIYDGESSEDHGEWDFAGWLPHVWSEDHKLRFTARDSREAADVFTALAGIFRDRLGQNGGSPDIAESPAPYYVVFISDPALMEGEPFAKYATGKYPACGLTVILLAGSFEELPNSCDYILQNTDAFKGGFGAYGSNEKRRQIKFDSVSSRQLEEFSRRISSYRVLEETGGGELPESLTFLEMLKVSRPEEIPVSEYWAKNRTYERLWGQIGVKAGGMPCILDAHERYHGPHGLVAGTTGSGKSETLQTYILSLAVNYSPDDVNFFIIDYKGGGMANLFEGLPHLAGSISNLSGSRVSRAMISINGEIRRRQKLFNESNVNNINNYTRLYKSGVTGTPLPHLFVIVDEFAELKMDQPGFMRELISVAQLGRSLGIHLILSTQKPGGTVDDNIWSNSRFRMCFRVQDRRDSMDVLHKPDAAYLTGIGRGYLQVGSDEVYEQFQSGYSGALYDDNAHDRKGDLIKIINSCGRVEMTGSSEKIRHSGRTELDAVIECLQKTAAEHGYDKAHRLWLPELRDKITLEEFDNIDQRSFTGNMRFVLGRWDDPVNQAQEALSPELTESGNIAVCGSASSGKSTMMQTIAYSLISTYSPDEINLYMLDFSSRMMSAFTKAPHTGGVMFEEDQDRISKFFNLMSSVLSERRTLLHGGSYRQYRMSHDERLPAIVIMIDNYAAFREKTEDQYEADLIRLAREGVSNGMFMIISGGGFGIDNIPGRIADNLNTVFALELPDRFAYASVLRVMRTEILPEPGISGRGLALKDGRVLEFQTALALEADNDYDRMEKIARQCGSMAESWHGIKARPVPEVPEKPVWKQFAKLEEYRSMRAEGRKLPVGYDCDNASVYGIPLSEIYCYGVYGSRMSGKTNFLRICAMAAMDQGASVCIIDDARESLGVLGRSWNVSYCRTDEEIFEYFESLIPAIQERDALKKQLMAQGLESEELFAHMRSASVPVFIFISDLVGFIQTVYDSEIGMSGFMENIFEKGSKMNIYFFAEMPPERRSLVAGLPVFEHFTGYRTGVRFGGRAIDDMLLLFDHLGYAERTAVYKPGIGLIAGTGSSGGPWKIKVPHAGRVIIDPEKQK